MVSSCPAIAHEDDRFVAFCDICDDLVRDTPPSGRSLARVAELTGKLVKEWSMPDDRYLQCQPDAMYGSYLLYLNASGTFNVVLDVFLPGQAVVIHNHRCWCAFTCLHGAERERLYSVDLDLSDAPAETHERICKAGEVRVLDDDRNLFHQVECASDSPAVSLHVYGADIGRIERDMWDEEAGKFVTFRSNYSNDLAGLPAYYEK